MIYQFNNFEVDLNLFEIRKDENSIAVEPKVFNLIVYLIEHRLRLVTRDELFSQVWQGREVSDTSLSNHIKSARKVLGDNGESQQVIKTVRSRGYQFIAETVEISNHETSIVNKKNIPEKTDKELRYKTPLLSFKNLYKRATLWLAGLLLAFVLILIWINTTTPQKSNASPYVVVVPFSVVSNDPVIWEPFTDQITRELIQGLRKVSGIKVVPPPSSFTFKTNKVRAYIRQQLPEVQFVLDGVVSEGTNGEIRITVELEDITTDALLWVGDFDVKKGNTNLFEIQADIATSVSHSLQIIILDDEKQTLNKFPTASLPAYDLYVKGQHYYSLMTHESLLQSIEYFNQAITLDPNFEAPYIGKSNSFRFIMTYFDKPRDVLPKAISSAINLLTINPKSAQIYSSLGLAYIHALLWEDAWKMLSKARKHDPNIALTELGFALYYSAMGEVEAVKSALAKASQLDPLNEEVADWGIWALMLINETDEAIKWGKEKMNLHPNNPYLMLALANAYYIRGKYDESIALAIQGVKLANREPFPLIILAQAYAAAGKTDYVQQLINEAEKKDQYMCPYETSIIYALMKQKDKAFDLLNEAVSYRSNCLLFARNDPRINTLKSDPRYKKLLKTIGLDDDSIRQYPR